MEMLTSIRSRSNQYMPLMAVTFSGMPSRQCTFEVRHASGGVEKVKRQGKPVTANVSDHQPRCSFADHECKDREPW